MLSPDAQQLKPLSGLRKTAAFGLKSIESRKRCKSASIQPTTEPKMQPPNKLPIIGLDVALQALEAAQKTPEELAEAAKAQEEQTQQVADACAKAMADWQREAVVKIVGEETVKKADEGDLKSIVKIDRQGLFIERRIFGPSKKNKLGGIKLVMKRKLRESQRVVILSTLTFHFGPDGLLQK